MSEIVCCGAVDVRVVEVSGDVTDGDAIEANVVGAPVALPEEMGPTLEPADADEDAVDPPAMVKGATVPLQPATKSLGTRGD